MNAKKNIIEMIEGKLLGWFGYTKLMGYERLPNYLYLSGNIKIGKKEPI